MRLEGLLRLLLCLTWSELIYNAVLMLWFLRRNTHTAFFIKALIGLHRVERLLLRGEELAQDHTIGVYFILFRRIS